MTQGLQELSCVAQWASCSLLTFFCSSVLMNRVLGRVVDSGHMSYLLGIFRPPTLYFVSEAVILLPCSIRWYLMRHSFRK